jgi:hypothetical protein
MSTRISLLSIVLLATSLVAQDAPIPQDLPLELRKTRDAVQRKVEQPIPRQLPLPTKRPQNDGLLNRLWPGRTLDTKVNAGPVEERVAALEAKVEALQRELEAQKVLIKQLQELLDRQQKKD